MKTTKQELMDARRVLVDHAVVSNVNDETFRIISGIVRNLEKEISARED